MRALASLRRPSFACVRMMFEPTHVAASIATRVVVSDTSDTSPPITPAIEVGPSASEISAMLESSVRSVPSSVRILWPSSARCTFSTPPRTLSRSNACSGWPITSIT